MMRIITGRARGTKLTTLDGEATRPTAERVKEAVFSMIQFDLEGRTVLDLFAGSGQLGLESVSRGAAHADLVDKSKLAVEVIRKNATKTRLALDCGIFCADFTEFLRKHRGRGQYDLVFLDPPYDSKVIPDALRALVAYDLLKPAFTVVCESRSEEDVFGGDRALASHFSIRKQTRYGVACVTILAPAGTDEDSEADEVTEE